MLERRRASQRQAEASAGETAEEMLERLQGELNAAPTTTAAPKAAAQGSEFLSVSGASTSTVVGGAQAGALVEGPTASGALLPLEPLKPLGPASFAGLELGDEAPGVRRVVVLETGDGEHHVQREEPREAADLRHPVGSPTALGPTVARREDGQRTVDGSQVVGGNPNGDGITSSASKGDRVVLMGSSPGDRKLCSPASVERPPGLLQHGGPESQMVKRPDSLPEASASAGVQLNPFWSPEVKAMERLRGEGWGIGQWVEPDTPQKQHVELDPIELFRIRCLREAEEKFRQGLLMMKQDQGSQASFASAEEIPETGGPKPPPGPPPASPQKMDGVSSGSGGRPPPPPPLPVPPFPVEPAGVSRGAGFLGENPNETLRTFELPRLTVDTTALQFGDWMSMVDSQMGDLSYSSNLWWGMVKSAAESCYGEWLRSGPLERLRLRPTLDANASLWPRTERRAVAMLLQAIPSAIRDDLVSSRRMTSEQIIFKLMVVYQPGGAGERTKLLQAITGGMFGETMTEVLEGIRHWRRNVNRASELGVTLPDALVLVGALQRASDFLSQKSPQVAYRLNMIRQQLNLDHQPTRDTVMSYSEHLQAEAEEMNVNSQGLGLGQPTSKSGGGKVNVKSLNGPSPGASANKAQHDGADQGDKAGKPAGGSGITAANAGSVTSSMACKFWGTENGCRKADQCRYVHSVLNPKDNRCFKCSAVGHSKKDCPVGKKKIAKTKVEKDHASSSASAAKGGAETAVKAEPSRHTTYREEGTPTKPLEDKEGVDDMVQDCKSVLKVIVPVMKTICAKGALCKAASEMIETGLLDGGATNPLRKGSKEEIEAATLVDVELATGSVQLYQNMSTGVLLSPTEVEPIVPLRGVVALGYKIRWDSRGCVISHPEVGRISCWLRNGCPVVRKQHALQLIKEIEDQERFKRLGPKLAAGQLSAEERQWWNQRYPDVPDSVLEFMVGQNAGMPKGETLPWNRRVRKRLRKAKGVIIHLFAGSRQSAREWQKGWPPGIEILTVDTADSDQQNLHRPEVWAFLAHVVRTHPIVAIIGGPPCRTVNGLRALQSGPRPLRDRCEHRFGLPGLSDQEQHKVDGDSALLLKQVGLHRLAEESKTDDNPRVGFFLESPEDPAVWANEANSPTFWVWPEVTQLLEQPDMRLISFDQGRYGHERVKPTSCLSNLPFLEDLDQARCERPHGKVLHPENPERVKQTDDWSAWAPGLKHALRVSLNLLIHQCGLADNQLKKALSRQEWRTHILQGHRPYRRDCRACVLDMAAGPPHRRRMYSGTSAWSLGVDVVLFGETKDSISGDQVKYAVVATALVPVFDEDHQPPLQEPPTEVVEAPDWGEGLEESEFPLEGEEESGSPELGDEVAKASPDPANAPGADPENGGRHPLRRQVTGLMRRSASAADL